MRAGLCGDITLWGQMSEQVPVSAFAATRDASRAVQTVMDKGFADDPTVTWYSTRSDVFDAEHHRYVQMCAEPAYDHGSVHATTGFEGAAIWYPPGIAVADHVYEAFKKTLLYPERFAALGELAETCDPHRPTVPHWTLELIAVDPDAQNRGIGRALMGFGLAMCDRTGAPAFLASSNRANLSFYQRLGFSQRAEVTLPGMPAMYPMVRPAGGAPGR